MERDPQDEYFPNVRLSIAAILELILNTSCQNLRVTCDTIGRGQSRIFLGLGIELFEPESRFLS